MVYFRFGVYIDGANEGNSISGKNRDRTTHDVLTTNPCEANGKSTNDPGKNLRFEYNS